MKTLSSWFVVGAVAASVSACGGVTFSVAPDAGEGDAAVDAPSPGDAARDTGVDAGKPGSDAGKPPAVVCPDVQPTNGSPCAAAEVGLECEYGSDPQIGCDAIATCDSGAWALNPGGLNGACTTKNPSSCPATYADVPVGKTCDPTASCFYPQARCTCDVQCGGGLCAVPIDGGPNEKTWGCDVPPEPTKCPIPRAPLGSPCAQAGLSCDYGACSGNVAESCMNGVWVREGVACPAIAQGAGG